MSEQLPTVLVFLPTYERRCLFDELITQLEESALECNVKVKLFILDDKSSVTTFNYKQKVMKATRGFKSWALEQNLENNGGVGLWKNLNKFMKFAKRQTWDFSIVLADDLFLCERFFDRVIRQFRWHKAQNRRVEAVNILSTFPVQWKFACYIDGAYICTRRFFEVLRWTCKPSKPDKVAEDGTLLKVPRAYCQITNRIMHDSPIRIAPVCGVSFVALKQTESVLHPSEKYPKLRFNRTWVDTNFIDGPIPCA